MLRRRTYLVEMAAIPSLVQLQHKGNKKLATRKELETAHRRAKRFKTAHEAREAAVFAWECMRKRQIIQVYLDREAELVNPARPIAKPLFMDKKRVSWSKLDKIEKQASIRWLAGTKSESELEGLLKKAQIARDRKKTPDSIARAVALNQALILYRKNRKVWRDAANSRARF